jgi:hypothetical protein
LRLRVANCKSCGAPVRLEEDAPSVTCDRCGTVLTREDILRADAKSSRKHPNLTPVKLGMKGHFRGREYEVIGRLVLSTMEEGEKYTWTEFQLISAEGEVLYLELDEGDWKLMEPFVPLTPFDPKAGFHGEGSQVKLEQSNAVVTGSGTATVEMVEGELTYAATIGQQRSYLDAKTLSTQYAVEWTEDELEFYRGKLLSQREVLKAFGLNEQLRALESREQQGRSQTAFAAVCLLLSIVAFVMGGVALDSGTVVSKSTVTVSSVGQEGARFGPITLDPKRRVHRLTVFGQMSESSAWVSGVLEKGEGTELIGTQGDFWDESGHDSDGYWHESDLRKSSDFVARSPGPYYLRVYAESDNPDRAAAQTAGYELRAGAVYPTYFFVFGVISLLMSFLFFMVGSREKLAKMAEEAD